jgi:hypothetical protein
VWAALITTLVMVPRATPLSSPVPHLVRDVNGFNYLGLTAGQTNAPQLSDTLGGLPSFRNDELSYDKGFAYLAVVPDMAGSATFNWGRGSGDYRLHTIVLSIAAAQIRIGAFILYFGQPCYATRLPTGIEGIELVYPEALIWIKSDPSGRWNASSLVTAVFLRDSRFECAKIGRHWTGFRVH